MGFKIPTVLQDYVKPVIICWHLETIESSVPTRGKGVEFFQQFAITIKYPDPYLRFICFINSLDLPKVILSVSIWSEEFGKAYHTKLPGDNTAI